MRRSIIAQSLSATVLALLAGSSRPALAQEAFRTHQASSAIRGIGHGNLARVALRGRPRGWRPGPADACIRALQKSVGGRAGISPPSLRRGRRHFDPGRQGAGRSPATRKPIRRLDAADAGAAPVGAGRVGVQGRLRHRRSSHEGHVEPMTRVCYHGGVSSVLRDNLIDMPGIDRSAAPASATASASRRTPSSPSWRRATCTRSSWSESAPPSGSVKTIRFDAARRALRARHPARAARIRARRGRLLAQLALAAARSAAGRHHRQPRRDAGCPPHRTSRRRARRAPSRWPRLPPHARARSAPSPSRLAEMMQLTTSMGTARHSFRDRKGHPYLPIEVAGKTGTLFYRGRAPRSDPAQLPRACLEAGQLGYSWFVGFAPADQPRIAFAVLLGNPVAWQLRAHAVARHMIADYLASEAAPSTAASSRGVTWEPWAGFPNPVRLLARASPHPVAAGLRIQAGLAPAADTMLQPEVAGKDAMSLLFEWLENAMRVRSRWLAAQVTRSCTTTPICPGAGCFIVWRRGHASWLPWASSRATGSASC